jgi:hypothetical protein
MMCHPELVIARSPATKQSTFFLCVAKMDCRAIARNDEVLP